MPTPTLRELIRSDFARFTQTFKLRGQEFNKTKVLLESLFFKANFQAALLYRVSHWFYRQKWNYAAWFFKRLNQLMTGAEIEFNAEIGPGLFIAHSFGIVIGRGTVIGKEATLFQGVTFGVKSWHPDEIHKFPKVGDNCFFFAQCSVIGAIEIGNDCVVAAHTLVTQNMPDGSLARGVPAEIIPDEGKKIIASWLP